MKNGAVYTDEQLEMPGETNIPLTWDHVSEKYASAAGRVLNESQRARLGLASADGEEAAYRRTDGTARLSRNIMRVLIAFCLGFAAALPLHAQNYPSQPIKVVIPYPPGGGSDTLGRPIAAALAAKFRQPVVIDNRGGAAGNIGSQAVAKAEPDGYTLLMANNAQVINPFIYRNAGYGVGDFEPVAIAATAPMIVVVHRSSPADTLADLVALAKRTPSKLNFGSGGVGTPNHLAPLLFSKSAGIDMVHVAYKGAGPSTVALLAKEVDVVFSTPSSVAQHIKSGELRALAVTSKERFSAFPTVPTIAESGIPGTSDFAMDIWWGLLAPARTDVRIIDLLHDAVTTALRDPAIRERWIDQGLVPLTTTRAEFRSRVNQEMRKWEKAVKENAISAE